MLVSTITETLVPLVIYIWLQISVGIPSIYACATREPLGWLADLSLVPPFRGELLMLLIVFVVRRILRLPCVLCYRMNLGKPRPQLEADTS
jgi:hypothetical protein